VYDTDRGIEELDRRRGDETVTLSWLAEELRTFVDLHPEFETRSTGSPPGSRARRTTTSSRR
jgi:hypothetical protein